MSPTVILAEKVVYLMMELNGEREDGRWLLLRSSIILGSSVIVGVTICCFQEAYSTVICFV